MICFENIFAVKFLENGRFSKTLYVATTQICVVAMKEERVCPRCGSRYAYLEEHARGDRCYVYAVHKEGRGKSAKRWKCYLGPSGGYAYVSKTHAREGLVLKGLQDADRAFEYIDALIAYIETTELDENTRIRLAEKFRQLALVLENGRPGTEKGDNQRIEGT